MCRLCGGPTCHSEAQAVALDVASHGCSVPTALRLQSPCAAAQASAGELSAEMQHAHIFRQTQLTGQTTHLSCAPTQPAATSAAFHAQVTP